MEFLLMLYFSNFLLFHFINLLRILYENLFSQMIQRKARIIYGIHEYKDLKQWNLLHDDLIQFTPFAYYNERFFFRLFFPNFIEKSLNLIRLLVLSVFIKNYSSVIHRYKSEFKLIFFFSSKKAQILFSYLLFDCL